MPSLPDKHCTVEAAWKVEHSLKFLLVFRRLESIEGRKEDIGRHIYQHFQNFSLVKAEGSLEASICCAVLAA